MQSTVKEYWLQGRKGMVVTECPSCGAREGTKASVDANCYHCGNAKMVLIKEDD